MMRIFCLGIFCLLTGVTFSQSEWNWKDPNDLGFIDFGDNKVLLYNLVGAGLAQWLAERDTSAIIQHEFSFGAIREYDRAPLSNLYIAEYRGGKNTWKFLSVGLGGRCYWTETEDQDILGLGGELWFKWKVINKSKFRLSYDNGVGPNIFFSAFPEGGTLFNFTTRYALSVDVKCHGRWFNLRLTNLHISNADLWGRERNKALDGIGIQVGITP